MSTQKENKYPRGYWPKIEFWLETLEEVYECKDPTSTDYSVEYCIGKLKYFTQKQAELDGITAKF